MVDGRTAVHEDDETALSTEEANKELEEGVEDESLVDIAQRVDPEGDAEGGQTGPRGDTEDGDQHEDTDDMALEEGLAVVLALQEGDAVERVVSRARAGMCLDKRTYRTVRRQAISEDTPASIKTSLPNPEPVPALPGSLSAIVVIVCEVDMAMRSAAATAAVVSLRRLLLLHLPRLLFLHAPVQCPARYVQVFAGGVVILEQKTRPALQSRQLDSRCLFQIPESSSGESSAGSKTDTHQRHTLRHNHSSSASCDGISFR